MALVIRSRLWRLAVWAIDKPGHCTKSPGLYTTIVDHRPLADRRSVVTELERLAWYSHPSGCFQHPRNLGTIILHTVQTPGGDRECQIRAGIARGGAPRYTGWPPLNYPIGNLRNTSTLVCSITHELHIRSRPVGNH